MWREIVAGPSRDIIGRVRALRGGSFFEIGLSPLKTSRSSDQGLVGSEEKQIHPPRSWPKVQARGGAFLLPPVHELKLARAKAGVLARQSFRKAVPTGLSAALMARCLWKTYANSVTPTVPTATATVTAATATTNVITTAATATTTATTTIGTTTVIPW